MLGCRAARPRPCLRPRPPLVFSDLPLGQWEVLGDRSATTADDEVTRCSTVVGAFTTPQHPSDPRSEAHDERNAFGRNPAEAAPLNRAEPVVEVTLPAPPHLGPIRRNGATGGATAWASPAKMIITKP